MKRKITNIALLFVLIVLPTAFTRAQAPAVGDEAATPRLPNPQLEFVGQEIYEVNGSRGIRYKLSVKNRASHPDFLWRPTQHLAPCGNNKNSARTGVEIFGSPGDKRLAGFCALRASEDLGHLWFPVPAAETGPPCVYLVMTDRQTGKKYISNRVCSRSFTVATGSLKGSVKPGTQASKGRHEDG